MHDPSRDGRSSKRWRVIIVGFASLGLLAALIFSVDGETLARKIEFLQPRWAAVAIMFFFMNLGVRGWRLQCLDGGQSSAGSLTQWIRIAALHQLLFTALPSGVGDVGFPMIAKRVAGIPIAAGTRLISIYRLQDIWALLLLMSFGLLSYSHLVVVSSLVISLALGIAALALIWSDRLTYAVIRVAQWLLDEIGTWKIGGWTVVPRCDRLRMFLQSITQYSQVKSTMAVRVGTAALTLVSWGLAAAAFWCLFAMASFSIDLSALALVISGLNLFGALATFSVGGLGIGETALAAILIALRSPPDEATATALIVRPAALVNVLISCSLVELTWWSVRLPQVLTKPKG